MVVERKYVDLEDNLDLAAIVRSVREDLIPVSLREAGEEIAVLSPSPKDRKAAIMELAGSMRGLVDEAIVEEIYRRRGMSNRPPVEL